MICWQLRCMKNSRLDGVLMQLYPDPESGRKFLNLEHFENCLKLARQEGFRLGIHDEIQFMPKSAKEISAFIERASSVLALAGKYPEAFLRRNGKILYQYEAWNLPYSAAEHQQIMEAVERKSGEKIYWMVSGPAEKMVQVEALGCLKLPANTWSHCRKETTRAYGTGGDRWEADSELPDDTLYWDKWRESLRKSRQLVAEANRKRKNKLEQAVWIYPGFNNAGRWSKLPEVMPDRSFDRDAFFLKAIRIAQQEVAPAIVNLSSWNDREEKTALEPSWSNENADPFASVRLLAKMKGARFTEPPLPPKEYVDPWMWSILYGHRPAPRRAITGLPAACFRSEYGGRRSRRPERSRPHRSQRGADRLRQTRRRRSRGFRLHFRSRSGRHAEAGPFPPLHAHPARPGRKDTGRSSSASNTARRRGRRSPPCCAIPATRNTASSAPTAKRLPPFPPVPYCTAWELPAGMR